jgi:hypothetical protein
MGCGQPPTDISLVTQPLAVAVDESRSHIGSMILDLSDDQDALLAKELTATIEGERLLPLAAHSDVARDSQHDSTRTEARTAP